MAFVATREPHIMRTVRDAFVQRDLKPSYADLSVEFGIPLGTIGREAAEQNWVSMRARHLEHKSKEGDALSVILAAVNIDQRVISAYSNFAFITLAKLTLAVESIGDDKAATTKLDALNTATFAAKNLADALRVVGIVGVSKTLNAAGQEENNRWNPSLLNQINVTVQTLQKEAEKEKNAGSGSEKNPPIDLGVSP